LRVEGWSERKQPPADVTVAMDLNELAVLLVGLGCPPAKSAEMAAQLDKRARQLAEQKGRSYEDALAHLLELMRQGWAAKESGP
jgi:altronate dehydratase